MASRPNTARPEVETLQRTRRIETRLTQLMIGLGIHTDAQKPVFDDGTLLAPSVHSSLKEIIDSVPADWQGPIRVFVGSTLVTTICR